MSQCYLLQNQNSQGKQEGSSKSPSNTVGCVASMRDSSPIVEKVSTRKKIPEMTDQVNEEFQPFVMDGEMSIDDENSPQSIKIVRDTCCSQSLVSKDALPFGDQSSTGTCVLIRGINMEIISVPLHRVNLECGLVSGQVLVGVMSELPIKGVSMMLGNDLAGDKVHPNPIVTNTPSSSSDNEEDEIFPACVMTRAMSKKADSEKEESGNCQNDAFNLEDTFFKVLNETETSSGDDQKVEREEDPLSRNKLILEQSRDPKLTDLVKGAVTPQEVEENPVCFYKRNGVLMRKWRPLDAPADEEWQVVHQIVVPEVYPSDVMSMAHDSPMAGHLGVRKTCDRILKHFWWPRVGSDVADYCRSCHTCQVVGKPNQKIPTAPLKPIPAFDEPFSRVIIDCVGPLPKTKSGNQYLLTIMCASTRFPEAIPLRNIKATTVVKALTKFFTLVGLPKSIQSDQGSNFTSGLFQQVMYQLGIDQHLASAYHPESQGALERFHQTLKNMIRTYCLEFQNDWDEGVHLLLFAAREAVQETLGFSPFELVFGHTVRGPLKLLKEKWLSEISDMNLLDYVSKFKTRLNRANEIARQNLEQGQAKMKQWYDKNVKNRVFKPGDKVLVLFPIRENPLQARYFGPYEVESKMGDVNYVIKTPGRRKSRQLCHINMLKEYMERNGENVPKPVCSSTPADVVQGTDVELDGPSDTPTEVKHKEYSMKLQNSDVLENLEQKFSHLSGKQQVEMTELVKDYGSIFPDTPSRTNAAFHDIDVSDTPPIKQHPYRVNPLKMEYLKKEINYMLDNDIIEPSSSEWSSPCILIPKPDGSYRLVADMRAVNEKSKTDSYPIPRIDDCIDKIGNAKFVSKFDLLKGYWQVPLTERAKEITAFCTPFGLYQYKVMPFGLKNAPATFQRMVNQIVMDLDGCEAYVDDLIVYSQTWEQHISQLRQLFQKLSEAKLTVNLVKSEFCHASVTYLGHVVGQGQVQPLKAKVEAIENYPAPTNKKALMRFLGMVGYYRKFCPNFSDIASPLTDLLKKNVKFLWTNQCENAFQKIKSILMSSPILTAPNFQKQFKLVVDASDIGCGSVVMQEGEDQVDHPILFEEI